MNNSQNNQQDGVPLPTAVDPVFLASKWGNSRCATQMHVTETMDTFCIQTTLIGLVPESLIVTIQGSYLIVEGTILQSGGRGRYARHVPEIASVREDYMDVTYQANGALMVIFLKRVDDHFE